MDVFVSLALICISLWCWHICKPATCSRHGCLHRRLLMLRCLWFLLKAGGCWGAGIDTSMQYLRDVYIWNPLNPLVSPSHSGDPKLPKWDLHVHSPMLSSFQVTAPWWFNCSWAALVFSELSAITVGTLDEGQKPASRYLNSAPLGHSVHAFIHTKGIRMGGKSTKDTYSAGACTELLLHLQ